MKTNYYRRAIEILVINQANWKRMFWWLVLSRPTVAAQAIRATSGTPEAVEWRKALWWVAQNRPAAFCAAAEASSSQP